MWLLKIFYFFLFLFLGEHFIRPFNFRPLRAAAALPQSVKKETLELDGNTKWLVPELIPTYL